jgi:predicted DsbA family dithiol-disulfide isomerase
MRIDFWFDPACPWCWLTSRWVLDVAPHRDLTVRWRPISLLIKNNTPPESPYHAPAKHTLGLLRVVESVRAEAGDEAIEALYTAYGTHIHHDKDTFVDAAVGLREAGLPEHHAAAFDDERWDEAIRASMEEGLALTGNDVGTPIIAYTAADGTRQAFFGPVISRRLPLADALTLWDAVSAAATIEGFWELKRTRTEAPDFTPAGA